jgi:AcrR family transcriptional regulator
MSETAGPSAQPSPADRAIDAFLELVAGRGWRNVALADVAGASGLSPAELYGLFPSKQALLTGFMRRVDAAALARPADQQGSVRDRLFELLMRRFDALAPHRAAIKSVLRAAPCDPALPLCVGPRFMAAMRWTADAAGVDTTGLLGALRVKGVAGCYLWALRVFVDDDSADHAKTMAALDQALARAEMLARSIPGARPRQDKAA